VPTAARGHPRRPEWRTLRVSATDPTRRLNSLLKRLRAQHHDLAPEPASAMTPVPEWADAAVDEFLLSFLMWESTTAKARAALRRVRECVVDYNELRVCLPHELSELFGERYPRAQERTERLHAALTDLYKREHAMSLTRLAEAPKRDALAYLASLEGVPSYVASRVLLVSLGGHAVPVDERLLALLIGEGIAEAGATVEAAASWMDRHVRAPEGMQTHLLLQAWSDEGVARKDKKSDRAGVEKTSRPRAKKQRARS